MGPAFGEVPGALAWIGTAIGVVGYFSVTLADALVIEAIRTLSAAEVVADTNAYIVPLFSVPKVTVRTCLDRKDQRGSVQADTRKCLSGFCFLLVS
jgi:hypothetical protein